MRPDRAGASHPPGGSDSHYTFGTGQAAARRLEEIARFFNPLAGRWIRERLGDSQPARCIDLGCGPGFTTDMLARATGAARATGLDRSAEQLALARARFPAYEFLERDASAPLPHDTHLLHCRFLLSHLPDPAGALDRWVAALPAGGWLFADEFRDVRTELPLLREYVEANEKLVATGGGRLKVGAALARARYAVRPVENIEVRIPVPDAVAAGWLVHNARDLWPERPEMASILPAAEQRRIAEELEALCASGSEASHTEWVLQRLVFRQGAAG